VSTFDDYHDEMLRRPLNDEAIEALLAGRPTDDQDLAPVASLFSDLRGLATTTAPVPTPGLAAVLAGGFSPEKGDLLATAASNVTGPAPQAAGLPKRRRRNMIEVLLAKLASAGLVAKAGLTAGALTLSATAAATTGVLPDPVQDRAADAVERVMGIDIPGGRSGDHRKDADHSKDGSQVADDKADTDGQDGFGTSVADRATAGEPTESGADFGKSVSTEAVTTHQPATATKPTAESNPGTSYRPEAGAQQPASTPTAESNPGTSYQEGAEQPSQTPTAESNPGSGYPEGAEQPSGTPTGEGDAGSDRRP